MIKIATAATALIVLTLPAATPTPTPDIQLAATVIALPGAFGVPTNLRQELGGQVTDGNTFKPFFYVNTALPSNIPRAAAKLDNVINNTGDDQIVLFSHSEGSIVIDYWLNHYAPTSTVPPNRLSVVQTGDSVRRYGGVLNMLTPNLYSEPTPTDTPYQVINVARQYDEWADFPNRILSPNYMLAVKNAVMGNLHGEYDDVDIYDPKNLVYREGNTTYVLVPTDKLPILRGASDPVMQAKIESAYRRPETKTAAEQGITIPAVTAPADAPAVKPVVKPAVKPRPVMKAIHNVVSKLVHPKKVRGDDTGKRLHPKKADRPKRVKHDRPKRGEE